MNTLRYLDFGSLRPLLLLIARIAVVALFIIFGVPKMTGFSGTVEYMAAVGAPLPMLSAIIAVVMEVLVAILIVLGFFTRPLAVIFLLYTLGTAVIGHHYWNMTGADVAPNMINFYKKYQYRGGIFTAGTGRTGRLVSGSPLRCGWCMKPG
ncbi:Inner membrane protein yphA [Pluralibacter gergoviae]|nr:Inner membrane protein yphA [Pluralibacter gergoviae]